jgi:hypothetical protein
MLPKVSELWRLNIKRKGVKDVDNKCPVCQRLDEDGGHCFLKCKMVKRAWRVLNLEQVHRVLLRLQSAREVVHHILKMEAKVRSIVSCFLWVWWEDRNKANEKERMMSLEEVAHRTMDAALSAAHDTHGPSASKSRDSKLKKWQPPPTDVLKINFDGAFRVKEGDDAWGFVIRDSEGTGILAPEGVIFQEIREVLDLHFTLHGVSHISRSSNKCAHELARSGLARDPDDSIVWNAPLPSFVIYLVGRDHADPLVDE